jgi:quercetin dioxygenase-like cupin family protein/molybdopterin converting factor small subunit
MRVQVRFVGIVADVLERRDAALELADDATVGDLLDRLVAMDETFAAFVGQVAVVADGQNATRATVLREGADVAVMRPIGGGAGDGARVVHAELPIVPSPSGLPTQHIVGAAVGATQLFVGQQWLEPGERVFLHTHPCEEVLTFLAGSGEATLGDDIVPIAAGVSLFIPTGVLHGFRNTGTDQLHVMVVFPVPHFAETVITEAMLGNRDWREFRLAQ